jgi:ligand-binding SRPBCC domain-containing protein
VPRIKEDIVAGCTSGLIGPNQHTLMEAKVAGIRISTEMKLTHYAPPFYFSYEIVNSVFESVVHEYYFYDLKEETVMVDNFYFETRFGILGEILNFLFLKRFLVKAIQQRDEILREYAEGDKWRTILSPNKTENTIVC